MPTLSQGPALHLETVACATGAPAVFGNARVGFGELVAVGTVGLGALRGSARLAAKRKARKVPLPFLAEDVASLNRLRRPRDHGVCLDAKLFRDLDGNADNPVDNNVAGVAPVALLLAARCPAAVVGRIPKVVVDAVNTVSGRSRRHVRLEVGVGVPPLADSDATAAVVRPLAEPAPVASLHHGLPDRIERRFNLVGHGPENTTACHGTEQEK